MLASSKGRYRNNSSSCLFYDFRLRWLKFPYVGQYLVNCVITHTMHPKLITSSIPGIFILAGVYFLLGIAGLQLAVPPGYASAIFPAAGVSVVAILLGGKRLLPGVWLGSVSINLWVAWIHDALDAKSLFVAAAIALGSTLQAWIAGILVRYRLKDIWRILDNDKDIIRFLMLAGPLACLISASWGNSTLALFNVIAATEFASNWWNWWVGDTIGVLLFAPLTLMALQRHNPLWKTRLTHVAMPTLAATAGIIIAFVYVSNSELLKFKQRINEQGLALANQLQIKLLSYEEIVASLNNFVRVSPNLSFSDFERFTRQNLVDHPELQALSWNPLIADDARQQFEAAMAKEFDVPDFHIVQLDRQAQLAVADIRDHYVAVRYISPIDKNREALGFDITSDPVRLSAINAVTQSGKTTVTAPVRLVQDSDSSAGVLLLDPVYQDQSTAGQQLALDNRKPFGFTVVVFQVEEMLARYFVNNLPDTLVYALEDKDAPEGNKLLYRSGQAMPSQFTKFAWEDDIPFGGRLWHLSVYPTPAYFAGDRSLLAWMVQVAGLVLASLLQAFLLAMTGRTAVIQRQVNEQTKELSLKEKFLRLSQEGGGIGTWETDLVNNRQVWSENCTALLGLPLPNEPTWEDFLALVRPEDRQRVIDATQAHIDSGAKYDVEYRTIELNGSIRWMRSAGQVERDAEGKPVMMRGIVQDVSGLKQAEEALRLSEARFRSIIDASPVPYALNDDFQNITYLNAAFIRTFGYTLEDIPTLADWWPKAYPDSSYRQWVAATWKSRLDKAKQHDAAFESIELNIHCKDGRVRTALVGATMLEGAFSGTHPVIFYDITERKLAENDLRIAATVFESQQGMLVTDADNVILQVNRAFTHITGYTAEEVIGRNPRILQSGRQDTIFYTAMWDSINSTGTWEGELWNRRKNGEIFPEHLTVTAVKGQDDRVTNYVATLSDITLSKAAADEIELLAFYDPLTGLPNRRLLLDRLKPALASSQRSGRNSALLFIDMDNFKTLNDTLGHDLGDILLQQVAERLTSCVREVDTVARLGGDEFVVMLEDLSELSTEAMEQTDIVGNKILAALNRPYLLIAHNYHSTPSIGATLFKGHQQTVDELLKQADIAMYQAKASGRNTLRFFDPQMQSCITARAELEADLRLALAEDQFELYYQLQVYHSDQVIGAEVLIRWQHPQRGLVAPADFIPVAEETGLILPIGQWVLETACAQIKLWEASEDTQYLQLAVNVSARQFRHVDFVEKVLEVLGRSAIKPDRLKLELTESMVLDDIDDTILKINALREIGVRFSMDDFGTGYSSLSSLRKLPIDQLKIDQSFVHDIVIDPDDAVIVQAIIAMTTNLGMEIIAEGVETEAQRAFLEQYDCQVCQGYLFGKPVPIEQFEALLMKRS